MVTDTTEAPPESTSGPVFTPWSKRSQAEDYANGTMQDQLRIYADWKQDTLAEFNRTGAWTDETYQKFQFMDRKVRGQIMGVELDDDMIAKEMVAGMHSRASKITGLLDNYDMVINSQNQRDLDRTREDYRKFGNAFRRLNPLQKVKESPYGGDEGFMDHQVDLLDKELRATRELGDQKDLAARAKAVLDGKEESVEVEGRLFLDPRIYFKDKSEFLRAVNESDSSDEAKAEAIASYGRQKELVAGNLIPQIRGLHTFKKAREEMGPEASDSSVLEKWINSEGHLGEQVRIGFQRGMAQTFQMGYFLADVTKAALGDDSGMSEGGVMYSQMINQLNAGDTTMRQFGINKGALGIEYDDWVAGAMSVVPTIAGAFMSRGTSLIGLQMLRQSANKAVQKTAQRMLAKGATRELIDEAIDKQIVVRAHRALTKEEFLRNTLTASEFAKGGFSQNAKTSVFKEGVERELARIGIVPTAGLQSAGATTYDTYLTEREILRRQKQQIKGGPLTPDELAEIDREAQHTAIGSGIRAGLVTAFITDRFGLTGTEAVGKMIFKTAGSPTARARFIDNFSKFLKQGSGPATAMTQAGGATARELRNYGVLDWFIKGAVSEGVEEALDEGLNGAFDTALRMEGSPAEKWAAFLEQVRVAGTLGFALGATVEGISPVIQNLQNRGAIRAVQEDLITEGTLMAIMENDPEIQTLAQQADFAENAGAPETAQALRDIGIRRAAEKAAGVEPGTFETEPLKPRGESRARAGAPSQATSATPEPEAVSESGRDQTLNDILGQTVRMEDGQVAQVIPDPGDPDGDGVALQFPDGSTAPLGKGRQKTSAARTRVEVVSPEEFDSAEGKSPRFTVSNKGRSITVRNSRGVHVPATLAGIDYDSASISLVTEDGPVILQGDEAAAFVQALNQSQEFKGAHVPVRASSPSQVSEAAAPLIGKTATLSNEAKVPGVKGDLTIRAVDSNLPGGNINVVVEDSAGNTHQIPGHFLNVEGDPVAHPGIFRRMAVDASLTNADRQDFTDWLRDSGVALDVLSDPNGGLGDTVSLTDDPYLKLRERWKKSRGEETTGPPQETSTPQQRQALTESIEDARNRGDEDEAQRLESVRDGLPESPENEDSEVIESVTEAGGLLPFDEAFSFAATGGELVIMKKDGTAFAKEATAKRAITVSGLQNAEVKQGSQLTQEEAQVVENLTGSAPNQEGFYVVQRQNPTPVSDSLASDMTEFAQENEVQLDSAEALLAKKTAEAFGVEVKFYRGGTGEIGGPISPALDNPLDTSATESPNSGDAAVDAAFQELAALDAQIEELGSPDKGYVQARVNKIVSDHQLKVAQLKKLAALRGETGVSKLRKGELITALQAKPKARLDERFATSPESAVPPSSLRAQAPPSSPAPPINPSRAKSQAARDAGEPEAVIIALERLETLLEESRQWTSPDGNRARSDVTEILKAFQVKELRTISKYWLGNTLSRVSGKQNIIDNLAMPLIWGLQHRFANQGASLTGRRVNGFLGTDGAIWINLDVVAPAGSKVPTGPLMMNVLGHELTEYIRRYHPDLFEQLRSTLSRMVKSSAQEIIEDRYSGYRSLDPNADIQAELVADIVGDNLTNQDFWDAMATQNEDVFGRIAKIVAGWINKVLAYLGFEPGVALASQNRGYGTEGLIYKSQLQSSRDAVVNTLINFQQLQAEQDPLARARTSSPELDSKPALEVATTEFITWLESNPEHPSAPYVEAALMAMGVEQVGQEGDIFRLDYRVHVLEPGNPTTRNVEVVSPGWIIWTGDNEKTVLRKTRVRAIRDRENVPLLSQEEREAAGQEAETVIGELQLLLQDLDMLERNLDDLSPAERDTIIQIRRQLRGEIVQLVLDTLASVPIPLVDSLIEIVAMGYSVSRGDFIGALLNGLAIGGSAFADALTKPVKVGRALKKMYRARAAVAKIATKLADKGRDMSKMRSTQAVYNTLEELREAQQSPKVVHEQSQRGLPQPETEAEREFRRDLLVEAAAENEYAHEDMVLSNRPERKKNRDRIAASRRILLGLGAKEVGTVGSTVEFDGEVHRLPSQEIQNAELRNGEAEVDDVMPAFTEDEQGDAVVVVVPGFTYETTPGNPRVLQKATVRDAKLEARGRNSRAREQIKSAKREGGTTPEEAPEFTQVPGKSYRESVAIRMIQDYLAETTEGGKAALTRVMANMGIRRNGGTDFDSEGSWSLKTGPDNEVSLGDLAPVSPPPTDLEEATDELVDEVLTDPVQDVGDGGKEFAEAVTNIMEAWSRGEIDDPLTRRVSEEDSMRMLREAVARKKAREAEALAEAQRTPEPEPEVVSEPAPEPFDVDATELGTLENNLAQVQQSLSSMGVPTLTQDPEVLNSWLTTLEGGQHEEALGIIAQTFTETESIMRALGEDLDPRNQAYLRQVDGYETVGEPGVSEEFNPETQENAEGLVNLKPGAPVEVVESGSRLGGTTLTKAKVVPANQASSQMVDPGRESRHTAVSYMEAQMERSGAEEPEEAPLTQGEVFEAVEDIYFQIVMDNGENTEVGLDELREYLQEAGVELSEDQVLEFLENNNVVFLTELEEDLSTTELETAIPMPGQDGVYITGFELNTENGGPAAFNRSMEAKRNLIRETNEAVAGDEATNYDAHLRRVGNVVSTILQEQYPSIRAVNMDLSGVGTVALAQPLANSNDSIIAVDLDELARLTETMSPDEVVDFIQTVIDHEAIHVMASRVYTHAQMVEMGRHILQNHRGAAERTARLYLGAFGDTVTEAQILRFLGDDPNMTQNERDYAYQNLAHEFLRMIYQETKLGGSNEQFTIELADSPGLLRRVLRYLKRVFSILRSKVRVSRDPVLKSAMFNIYKAIHGVENGRTVNRGTYKFDPRFSNPGAQVTGTTIHDTSLGQRNQHMVELLEGNRSDLQLKDTFSLESGNAQMFRELQVGDSILTHDGRRQVRVYVLEKAEAQNGAYRYTLISDPEINRVSPQGAIEAAMIWRLVATGESPETAMLMAQLATGKSSVQDIVRTSEEARANPGRSSITPEKAATINGLIGDLVESHARFDRRSAVDLSPTFKSDGFQLDPSDPLKVAQDLSEGIAVPKDYRLPKHPDFGKAEPPKLLKNYQDRTDNQFAMEKFLMEWIRSLPSFGEIVFLENGEGSLEFNFTLMGGDIAYEMQGSIHFDPDTGEKFIIVDYLLPKDVSQRNTSRPVSLEALANLMVISSRDGLTHIGGVAGRGIDRNAAGEEVEMTGYKAWPSLGFETTMDPEVFDAALLEQQQKSDDPLTDEELEELKELAGPERSVLKLINSGNEKGKSRGLVLWQRGGFTFDIFFDLTPGSTSLQQFAGRALKLAVRGRRQLSRRGSDSIDSRPRGSKKSKGASQRAALKASPHGRKQRVPVFHSRASGRYNPGGWLQAAFRWDPRLYKGLEKSRAFTARIMKEAELLHADLTRTLKQLFGTDPAAWPLDLINTALGNTDNHLTDEQVQVSQDLHDIGVADARGQFMTSQNQARALDNAANRGDTIDIRGVAVSDPETLRAEARSIRWQARVDLQNAIEATNDMVASFEKTARMENLTLARQAQITAMAQLPQEVQTLVAEFRSRIDDLSRALRDEGAIDGNLMATFDETEGIYLHRSYRIFDEPHYTDWVLHSNDPEAARLRSDTENFITDMMIRERMDSTGEDYTTASAYVTPEMVHHRMLDYLSVADRGATGLLHGAHQGIKPVDVLLEKGNIPPEIRRLWGEYNDPSVNAAKTMGNLGAMLANHRFLNEVRDLGTSEGWLSTSNIGPDGERLVYILEGVEGDPRYAPLGGLFGPPQLRDAFRKEYMGESRIPLLRFLMGITGYAMMTKTALSFQATMRNFVGNLMFMVANNFIGTDFRGRFAHAYGVFNNVFKGHPWAERFYNGMSRIFSPMGQHPAATRQRVLRYVELGIVGDAAVENLINELIGNSPSQRNAFDSNATNQFFRLLSNAKTRVGNIPLGNRGHTLGGVAGKYRDFTTRFYGAQDDFWKVVAFESEVERVRSYRPNATEAQIEEEAAQIVRDTMPTYSQAPEVVKTLRRFPFMSPFVTFSTEVWRTSFGLLRTAGRQVNEGRRTGNQAMVEAGIERFLGFGMATAGFVALVQGVRMLLGFNRQDEEDLRRHVPPWEEDSELLMLKRTPEGKITYMNLTYINPYDVIIRPFRATARRVFDPDVNVGTAIATGGTTLLDPILKEQIFFGAVVDSMRGVDGSKKQVYNDTDNAVQKATKSMEHIYKKALEPGTFASFERIAKAATGNVSSSGRSFGFLEETGSFLTGFKVQSVDPETSLTYASRKFNFDNRDASAVFTKKFKSSGTVSERELRSSYFDANRKREKAFLALRQKLISAVRLGAVTREEAIQILRSENVSTIVTGAVVNNQYIRYEPTLQTVTIARLKGQELGQDRISIWQDAREAWPQVIAPLSKDDPENASLLLGTLPVETQ